MSTPEENLVARLGEKHALEKTRDLEAQIKRMQETIDNTDGFASEAELFEIGALLGVCGDMGRNPIGERPGPKRGAILDEVKYRQNLLRDALNALNRMDANEGLCDQIRRALFANDED